MFITTTNKYYTTVDDASSIYICISFHMEIDHVSNKIIYHALYAVTFGKYHADDWKHILSRLPPSPQVDRMETMMSWENKHL